MAATSPSSPEISSPRIAIIGNPNVGKSTIFNYLTGLNQKIGNYPGVTVDKKVGFCQVGGETIEILDLPGTYSLFPNSEDEIIVHRVLNNPQLEKKPDYVLMVIDSTQLSRGLFLATQLIDLGLPLAILLNMSDLAQEKKIELRTFELFKHLGVPILQTDARNQKGLSEVKELIHQRNFSRGSSFVEIATVVPDALLEEVKNRFSLENKYQAYQMIRFGAKDKAVSEPDRSWLVNTLSGSSFSLEEAQLEETKIRYKKITDMVTSVLVKKAIPKPKSSLDAVFLHPVAGYFIFFGILLLFFKLSFPGLLILWIGLMAFLQISVCVWSTSFPQDLSLPCLQKEWYQVLEVSSFLFHKSLFFLAF